MPDRKVITSLKALTHASDSKQNNRNIYRETSSQQSNNPDNDRHLIDSKSREDIIAEQSILNDTPNLRQMVGISISRQQDQGLVVTSSAYNGFTANIKFELNNQKYLTIDENKHVASSVAA